MPPSSKRPSQKKTKKKASPARAKAKPAPTAVPFADSKAAKRRDSDFASELSKAVDSFHTRLQPFRGGKPKRAAAEAAMKSARAGLKRIENLLAESGRFAHLGVTRVVADYQALLTFLDNEPFDAPWWNEHVIDRLCGDVRYFRSLAADLFHVAAGTSWWSKPDFGPYQPPRPSKKKAKG